MADLSEDSTIEWEAAQWVACRMGGEAFDEAGFDAWLAGDARRKPLFDTMWRRVMGADMDVALRAYRQRRRARHVALASAAGLLLACTGGYAAWPSVELFLAQPRHYASAEGGIREVVLEDGTRLTLAGGADIRVRYTGHDRVVELTQGTVFADVAHDARRPFRIDAGKARITDLGTRFEVSSNPVAVRVTVESGAVRLGANSWFGDRMDLSADQVAILTGSELSRIANVGAGGVARWRHEWVEYRDVPLSQVVYDLEGVSPLRIRIADEKLANRRVSGRVRLTDPVRQIDNLAVIHDFTITRHDGAIFLSSGKP
ncbi:FecR family protein [Sphingomonas fennica]|nr:FecR domain-containing protein [Sphingomonas fennica]